MTLWKIFLLLAIYLSKSEVTLVWIVLNTIIIVYFKIGSDNLGQIFIFKIISINEVFSHLLNSFRKVLILINNSTLRSLIDWFNRSELLVRQMVMQVLSSHSLAWILNRFFFYFLIEFFKVVMVVLYIVDDILVAWFLGSYIFFTF